ncbi:MAG: hypothetical protein INR66_23665 [Gordonia polyisoprenivorans]|nr:hypothetical protein [Gordonia polyisoprenivorans]
MTQSAFEPPRLLRLRLKPAGAAHGSVDGAWWPRTRNLEQELPEIAQTIGFRLPDLQRVDYHGDDWDRPSGRQIAIAGHPVLLAEADTASPGTVRFVGGGNPLTVALLSPVTDPEQAHLAMVRAADRDNSDSAHTLTSAAASDVSAQRQERAAEHDWDSEGGQVTSGSADHELSGPIPPAWTASDH